jgi:ABC-type multidrug transport system fused ATPase/permease subunit
MTVVLAKDTQAVEGVATESAAIMLQTMCALILSLIMGFFYSWQLVLFFFGFIPFLILGSIMQMKYDPNVGKETLNQDHSETKADVIASDCILNYRTVQSFGSDDIMIAEF